MSKLCWSVLKIKMFNCRFKNNLVTTLTFWSHVASSITWPFDLRLSMGCTLWPCVYLALLWKYEASNVGRTHGRTGARTLRWFHTLSNAIALHWTDNNDNN